MDSESNSVNCFSLKVNEKNCICSEIMFTSEFGIIIFKHPDDTPIFWNENAIKMLSNCVQVENYESLWEFLEKNKKDNKSCQLNIKGKIIEYDIYSTEHYKWAFLKDVTEQKRLESVAIEMNYMENLSNIFSSIRHEIANPLVTANITLSVLKKKIMLSAPEESLKYIRRVEESLDRVQKLVSSLKSFSMFDELQCELIEVNKFISEEIELMESFFEENNVDVLLKLSKEACYIKGDIMALRQIFFNIIFNAIDAMHNNENKTITIKTNLSNRKVSIEISNNGEKISEENLSRIFEPFFTTKGKGNGLGMAIVKKFVTMMQGVIEVKSNDKKTSFFIIFDEKFQNGE